MKGWRPLLLAAAVIAALVAVVLLSRRGAETPSTETPSATPLPTPAPVHLVLFFPAADRLLHREEREVPELPSTLTSRVRVVMEELLSGSRFGYANPFPWPATVDAVFVDREGNAYVDLSPPPAGAVEGTATEVALAYAAVSTVIANCPEVVRVQLIFGGREVHTLGHLDLSRPLAPAVELVAP